MFGLEMVLFPNLDNMAIVVIPTSIIWLVTLHFCLRYYETVQNNIVSKYYANNFRKFRFCIDLELKQYLVIYFSVKFKFLHIKVRATPSIGLN